MDILLPTSLRWQLLLPLLLACAAAALLVATFSWQLGRQWSLNDVEERFSAIERTVSTASFPLTASVADSLAALSGCELVALRSSGNFFISTLQLPPEELQDLGASDFGTSAKDNRASGLGANLKAHRWIHVADSKYLVLAFHRKSSGDAGDSVTQVAVLFDQARIDAASRRAALLPLATGLSTILMLGTATIFLTGRMTARVAKLEMQVRCIAEGDFSMNIADHSPDELGRLGAAVNKMTDQLRSLWQEVNRQQSQKLLHQMASGMAHQLRNTLTGARLALELHQKSLTDGHSEEVDTSLREMVVAEDYVQRILLVGSGAQQSPAPSEVIASLQDVRDSHAAVGKHLRVALSWQWDEQLSEVSVTDGTSFRAAISNLVLNALQAGKEVEVVSRLLGEHECSTTVSDDGPGIDAGLAERLFEPFVSSKPEGLGLGLTVVLRAAETLSGTIQWRRENQRTVFELRCRVFRSRT